MKGREVALKISRNKKADFANAKTEIKILQTLRKKDPYQQCHIVNLFDSFPFRKHMVLVFEILGDNLYRYMKNLNFNQMKLDLIKHVTF